MAAGKKKEEKKGKTQNTRREHFALSNEKVGDQGPKRVAPRQHRCDTTATTVHAASTSATAHKNKNIGPTLIIQNIAVLFLAWSSCPSVRRSIHRSVRPSVCPTRKPRVHLSVPPPQSTYQNGEVFAFDISAKEKTPEAWLREDTVSVGRSVGLSVARATTTASRQSRNNPRVCD